jgi:hypothetical protein
MRTKVVLLMCAAPLAFAQALADDNHAPAAAPAMAQPDTSGARPGDDAMTCEQIQSELLNLSSQPSVQAATNAAVAQAGAATKQGEDQQITPQKKHGGFFKGIAKAMGVGALGNATGGLSDKAAVAEQQRQIDQMGAAGHAAQAAQDQAMAAGSPLAGVSPQIEARGKHLVEMATARGCMPPKSG